MSGETSSVCHILRKAMWLNILTHVVLGLVLVTSGILYVRYLYSTHLPEKERQKQKQLFQTVLVVGLTIFAIIYTINAVLSEWGRVDKCYDVEHFIHDQFSYLKRSLDVSNITNKIIEKVQEAIRSNINSRLGIPIV